jgi:F-type H+-transporting ATPase subunit b
LTHVIRYPSVRRTSACEFIRKALVACAIVLLCGAGAAAAQPADAALDAAGVPASSSLAHSSAQAADAARQPAPDPVDGDTHAADAHATDAHADEAHGALSGLLWPTVNFIVLCGVLVYFLRTPLSGYLQGRRTGISKDLVEAAALRATATEQLAAIEQKVQALPGEIDALRRHGAEEIAAEEQRIAAQAAAERERLLEQTRREIDVQVRLAKRALVEHTADLAVQLATDRITERITPDDQDRLVDRYLTQLRADETSH